MDQRIMIRAGKLGECPDDRRTTFKKAGLKKRTTYYVQIRTYKTVKGKKYYSKWSKEKKVRTN